MYPISIVRTLFCSGDPLLNFLLLIWRLEFFNVSDFIKTPDTYLLKSGIHAFVLHKTIYHDPYMIPPWPSLLLDTRLILTTNNIAATWPLWPLRDLSPIASVCVCVLTILTELFLRWRTELNFSHPRKKHDSDIYARIESEVLELSSFINSRAKCHFTDTYIWTVLHHNHVHITISLYTRLAGWFKNQEVTIVKRWFPRQCTSTVGPVCG